MWHILSLNNRRKVNTKRLHLPTLKSARYDLTRLLANFLVWFWCSIRHTNDHTDTTIYNCTIMKWCGSVFIKICRVIPTIRGWLTTNPYYWCNFLSFQFYWNVTSIIIANEASWAAHCPLASFRALLCIDTPNVGVPARARAGRRECGRRGNTGSACTAVTDAMSCVWNHPLYTVRDEHYNPQNSLSTLSLFLIT